MARPCGCGGGGVIVRCGTGMSCSGVGTSSDPLVVGWELPLGTVACNAVMDCVGTHLGPAFAFNATTRQIDLKIDPDPNNTLSVGPAGVKATGGGSAPGTGTMTVAKLLALPTPVLGGSYGAGLSQFPEGTMGAYEAATDLIPEVLSMVHVPVRRTRELLPVCIHENQMTWYNPDVGEQIGSLDQKQTRYTEIRPSLPPLPAENGYFGFDERSEVGVPELGEVFNVLGNKTVLYLEAKSSGAPVDTIDRIKNMVPGWDLSKSVIVAAEPVIATGGSYQTILHALVGSMGSTGIPLAAHLTTAAQVSAYNAATLQGMGVGWVALPYFVMDSEHSSYIPGAVQAYKNAGIQVLMHTAHRQFHYNLAVTNGIRGLLSTDPIYCTGARNAYRYRRDGGLFGWNRPKYGVHSPFSYRIDGQSSLRRMFVRTGVAEQPVLHRNLQNPGATPEFDGSGYWMLMGEMGPYRNADRYAVQFWCYWDQMISDRIRWIGMFLDRDNDRVLTDWSESTVHTKGYLVSLGQNGNIVVSWYKGTAAPGNGNPPADATVLFSGPSGYTIQAGTGYGIRCEMDNAQLRVYRTGVYGGATTKTLITTLNGLTRYITGTNKGYPFMGRHFFSTFDACETRLINPSVNYSF